MHAIRSCVNEILGEKVGKTPIVKKHSRVLPHVVLAIGGESS